MKKIIVLLISLLSHTSGYDTIPTPTLITLKIESSEILSDSEGSMPLSPKHPIKVFPKLKRNFIEDKAFVIKQVDENSFEILGSPLSREIGVY
tara:strand:- start:1448 stop:1726 length:279 start_codon:yes stop_codon:yes gene_type:complete